MSYILEALKKSEEERRQGQVPDLSSLHGDSPPRRDRGMTVKVLSGICLIAIAAVIIMSLGRDRNPVEIPPPPRPQAVKFITAVKVAAPTVPQYQEAGDQNPESTTVRTVVPQDRTLAVEEPETETASGVTSLADLPPSFRNGLPRLSISAHFYADNPGARMASVNGQLLRQGDQVEPGITVREITPDGVVFESGGRAFLVPVY